MPSDRDSRDELEASLASGAAPEDATVTQVVVGSQLGPYLVEGLLGAGGMGQVFKARDTRLGRSVAIKTSHKPFDPRFAREAQAISALNHPHICTLYDVGHDYLVMELVEGPPLKGPLPVQKAVEYAKQILDALDAAHRKGIVHRDLKPSNILVGRQGVKLLDFGLAHLEGGPEDPTLTRPGMVMGTPAYMAPEQWEGKPADVRSDIYAFGCVLYEILSGKRASQERKPVSSESLERVLTTCLEKDPDERWQSARDIKHALDIQPTSPAPVPARGWMIPTMAALLTGLIGGWAGYEFRRPPALERRVALQVSPPQGGRFLFANDLSYLAVSPDGRTIVFGATANGKTGLWSRPLDSTEARFIPGTENAVRPLWSPDNKSIAFAVSGKLVRVDLEDGSPHGSPQVICECRIQDGGSWSGDRIVFATNEGLFEVQAQGGTPVQRTKLDPSLGENLHEFPQILPDGRLLYLARSTKLENQAVYVASVDKPVERVKLPSISTRAVYASGGDGKNYMIWERGSGLIADEFDLATFKLKGNPQTIADPVGRTGFGGEMNVSFSNTGVLLYDATSSASQFTWFDRGGQPRGTLSEPGPYMSFSLSPDGSRVAAIKGTAETSELWTIEVERGVASRLTLGDGSPSYPTWSPDGKTIVFRDGRPATLYRTNSDGSGDTKAIEKPPFGWFPSAWSRDGTLIYHETGPTTQADIGYLSLTSNGNPSPGAEPQHFLVAPFNQVPWGVSPEPNPHWITYISDESGRYEVYIQSFPHGGAKRQVSVAGGRFGTWGHNLREFFYISPDNKMMVVDLKPNGDSLDPSVPRELFHLPVFPTNGAIPYQLSPDGQQFLIPVAPDQSTQPLTVMINWTAALRKN